MAKVRDTGIENKIDIITTPVVDVDVTQESSTVEVENKPTSIVITDPKTGTAITVTPPIRQNIIVTAGGVQGTRGETGATGPQGPQGPAGDALIAIQDEGVELTPTASVLDFIGEGVTATASGSAVTINIPGAFPFIGDAEITGSLDVNGTGGDIFLIKSSSFGVFGIEETGAVTITNNAPTMFLIRNTSFAPILAVSQSGVVIFATQSAELTGTAPNGGLYFTSTSLFIGLD